MRAAIFKNLIIILTSGIFVFASCNTLEKDLNCANCSIVERTDLVISGAIDHSDFNQSEQSNTSTDLVDFIYYGNPSENFDFILNLSNGNKLVVRAYDAERMNPWQQVGQPYNIYPQSDLEDKLSYVKVELRTASNEPIYTTHPDNATSSNISLDVFKIIDNDGKTIHCRMRDMNLYSLGNTFNSISINGTFVGAVTF